MRIGDIGIGRKIVEKKSGMIFRVAGQDHYGEGITTLLTDHVIGVRALDAAENRKREGSNCDWSGKFGNNNYLESNLNQWLNSAEAEWYRPMNEYDNPPAAGLLRFNEHPYQDEPGFLTRFSDKFNDSLVFTDIPVIVRTGVEKAELSSVSAAVFLPSRTEMNKGDEFGIAEGKTLPIFYDHYIFKATPSPDQMEKYGRSWNPEEPEKGRCFDGPQLYDPKFGWWYLMRTPNVRYSFMERVMTAYGSVSFTYANNDVAGIRPLVNVCADTEVTDIGSDLPLYRL